MSLSYNLRATIPGPKGGISALAFSSDGRYLACAGGEGELRVFDLKTTIYSLIWHFTGSSDLTSVAWLGQDILAGTYDGQLLLFTGFKRLIIRYAKDTLYQFSSPVALIRVSPSLTRILVCAGADIALICQDDKHQWFFRDDLQRPSFGEVEGFDEPPIIATGVHFVEGEKACIATYLHHGSWKSNLTQLSCSQMLGVGEKIGFSAISPDGKAIAVTNIRTGIDWYRILPAELKHSSTSLEPQSQQSNIPLPLLFVNKGRGVLMGSTKGYAAVFDSKEGNRISTLRHGSGDVWVTALDHIYWSSLGSHFIATGDSNQTEGTKIRLWVQDVPTPRKNLRLRYLSFSAIDILRNVLSVAGAIYVAHIVLSNHRTLEAASSSLGSSLLQLIHHRSTGSAIIYSTAEGGDDKVLISTSVHHSLSDAVVSFIRMPTVNHRPIETTTTAVIADEVVDPMLQVSAVRPAVTTTEIVLPHQDSESGTREQARSPSQSKVDYSVSTSLLTVDSDTSFSILTATLTSFPLSFTEAFTSMAATTTVTITLTATISTHADSEVRDTSQGTLQRLFQASNVNLSRIPHLIDA